MKFIKFLESISKRDLNLVGGKAANLGEMYNLKLPVPNAFVVTCEAYEYFLEKTGIKRKIFRILKRTNVDDPKELRKNTKKIREMIEKTQMPEEIEREIVKAYEQLSEEFGKVEEYVAVRSSATAEDVPSVSEQEPVLVRVNGLPLLSSVKDVYEKFGGSGSLIEVLSMDGNKIKWKRVEEVYRHWTNSKLYRITTRTGKSIVVSSNHSLIVLDEKTLKPKVVHSITNVKIGDKVPVVKKIPLVNKLREIKLTEIFRQGEFVIHGGKLKLLNRSSNWKIQRGLTPKIKLTEDFGYFLGIFLADGTVDRKTNCVIVTNKCKKVREKVKKFLKEIDLEPKVGRKFAIRTFSRVFSELLLRICIDKSKVKGKGKGWITRAKIIPNFVFSSPREFIGGFLSGYLDGDGYVSQDGANFVTTSKQLAIGLLKLLNVLGGRVWVRKRKRRNRELFIIRVYFSEENILKLLKPEVPHKSKRLESFLASYKGGRHFDFLEVIETNPEILRRLVEDKAPKEEKVIYHCKLCGYKLEKTSYYRGKSRFYCRKCCKIFYKDDTFPKIERVVIDRDEKGRFFKGSIPWNKGRIRKRMSLRKLFEILDKYDLKSEDFKYLGGDIIWDPIKEIDEVDYEGFVYDFVVPETQTFVAGTGGIVTHNSASFAGQQLTLLNVKGAKNVVKAVKKCWASLFTARATFYRAQKGFEHEKVLIAVPVQKQLGVLSKEDYLNGRYKAGVGFTLHPSTGEKDKVVIEASWGQGESVVSGMITPDVYVLDKKSGRTIEARIGKKEKMRIASLDGEIEEVKTPGGMRRIRCLTRKELKQLWKLAVKLEKHYNFPQDFEWASENGRVYLVQTRPVTAFYEKTEVKIITTAKPILSGLAASPGAGVGKVKIVLNPKELHRIRKGDILVTRMTNPDFVPAFRKVSGIITSEGGITSHAAIVSRELGIPCVVGAENALRKLKEGETVTIDGRSGLVYEGEVKELLARERAIEITPEQAAELKTRTKVLMNLGVPAEIEKHKHLPFDGIGLMRVEFIIASWIRKHPNYLLERGRASEYVNNLAKGIEMVARAIYPRFLVVRFSDLKTNEYRELVGGKKFEPSESNPMIGWRGASRYISKEFERAFRLECRAIKKVRKKWKNVWVMLPFVRTVWEVEKCLKIMEEEGLKRGRDFKVWLMAEVPSVVFLADEFAKYCDCLSIGSNDLTQLILGVDRDSAILTNMGYFDERDEAVKEAIKILIKKAHKFKTAVSICGQAPSFYPEFTEYLIKCGIDSVSVNPDVVCKTRKLVHDMETRLFEKSKKQ